MKKVLLALAVLATSSTLFAADAAPAATAPATQPKMTLTQRVSYMIGHQIGGTLKRQGITIEPDAFLSGIQDAASGNQPKLSREEIQATQEEFQKEMAAKQASLAAEAAKAGENNLKVGNDFLAENAKKDGVKSLPSGLQYKVIKTGTGKSPKPTDTVEANYTGKLISGKTFDSSEGKPVEFPVTGVIAGWTEALQLMHEGDKWELYIPAKLAYGERGAGGDIGPNETLIFEVELVKVK